MSKILSPTELAAIYGTSPKQIRRWREENAPLDEVAALGAHLSLKRNQPAAVLANIADNAPALQAAIDRALAGSKDPEAAFPPAWSPRAAQNLNDLEAATCCFRCSMLTALRTETEPFPTKGKAGQVFALLGEIQDRVNALADLTGIELADR